MIVFPNAKINLGLHVINKRADGFHNIETIFYPVPFCDMLEVVAITEPNDNLTSKIILLQDGIKITGETNDNLIVKAYHLLDKAFDLPAIQCFLYKKIPMGAGLGGGSADAAFMLKLLNEKFDLKLSVEQLKQYASTLGSDCAFFIENKPAYVFGKGHELEKIDTINLKDFYLVIINPMVHSSTAMAYQHVSKREVLEENNSLKQLIQLPVKDWRNHIENDFEKSVFRFFPQLDKIKQDLYKTGATYAAMTGSGAALFALFDEQPRLSLELASQVCFSGLLQ